MLTWKETFAGTCHHLHQSTKREFLNLDTESDPCGAMKGVSVQERIVVSQWLLAYDQAEIAQGREWHVITFGHAIVVLI